MRDRVIVFAAVIILAATGAVAFDAYATTLPSPSSTQYFAVSLSEGYHLRWNGTGSPMILIDDVTFSGEPDMPAPAGYVDSVYGTADLGPGDVAPSALEVEWAAAAGALHPTYAAFYKESTSVDGEHMVRTNGRTWVNQLKLMDLNAGGGGPAIDEHLLFGGAFVAIREQTEVVREFHYESQLRTPLIEARMSDLGYGAGGVGVGVGVGVGAMGWYTVVSQSRHYQTPYIMRNQRIELVDPSYPSDFSGGVAYVKGRVITNTSEFPTLATDIRVSSNPEE